MGRKMKRWVQRDVPLRTFSRFFGIPLPRHYSTRPEARDVVIVGGAITGSATAYFLSKAAPFCKITVIEKDPAYKFCATTRSACSIRHQFSVEENIKISQFGIDFLRNVDDYLRCDSDDSPINVCLKEGGYLFLSSGPEGDNVIKKNWETQTKLGCQTSLLNPTQLKERFPWIETNGISMGSLGEKGEGWFDPVALLNAYRKKAKQQGVNYVAGTASRIQLDDKSQVSGVTITKDDGTTEEIPCGFCVNAAGSSGGTQLAKMINCDIPIVAKKRCVFAFKCKDPVENSPLVIDPTGVYFRPEGDCFITGVVPQEDPDVIDDYEVDYELFDNYIWPIIAERVPAFESLKLQSAWAGHYDMNLFDQTVIIGPHTVTKNFLFANGFSGHGLQQSAGIGRALAELIVHGEYKTLDLTNFGFQRLAENKPLVELNIV